MSEKAPVGRGEVILVCLAILAGLSLRLYFYTGLIANDDLTHVHAAYRLINETGELDQGALAGSAPVWRYGVNLPLALSMLVFGVREWALALVPLTFSLLGIVVIFGALRKLAGPSAGLLGAWLWACLPADIYTATAWLQDNIFATVCATAVLLLVCSDTCERRRWLFALLAGMAIGYMQYVKEVGWMWFGAIGAWWLYSCWKRRGVDGRGPLAVLGFLVIQAAVGAFYWRVEGDPLRYWKLTLGRLFSVYGTREPTYPYPEVFGRAGDFLLEQWIFGFAVVAFPLLAAAALLDKRTPARVLLTLLLATQGFIWIEAIKWLNWTQRYALQCSPLYLIFLVLGVRSLLSRLPSAWDRRLMPIAGLALIAATAAALRPEWQQHGRIRSEAVRQAYAYIQANAGDDDRIFVDTSPNVPVYTRRALSFLNGFQKLKGGFGDLKEAYAARDGWVILAYHEQGHMHLRSDNPFHGVARNWLEVFRFAGNKGRYYSRVFKILSEPLPRPIRVVEQPIFPADPPLVDHLEFEPIVFDRDPKEYLSRWQRSTRSVEVTREGDALRCDLVGDPTTDDSQYGGLTFAVNGLAALRIHVSLIQPQNVERMYVYAYGREQGQIIRWSWGRRPSGRSQQIEGPLVFLPGEPSALFRIEGDMPPDAITRVHVFIRITPGSQAGLILESAEVAAAPRGDMPAP